MPKREEIVWMNAENKVVPKDDATHARLHRYDKTGELIYEEWVDLDPSSS